MLNDDRVCPCAFPSERRVAARHRRVACATHSSVKYAAWRVQFHESYFQLNTLSRFAPTFAFTLSLASLSGPRDQTMTPELAA